MKSKLKLVFVARKLQTPKISWHVFPLPLFIHSFIYLVVNILLNVFSHI